MNADVVIVSPMICICGNVIINANIVNIVIYHGFVQTVILITLDYMILMQIYYNH